MNHKLNGLIKNIQQQKRQHYAQYKKSIDMQNKILSMLVNSKKIFNTNNKIIFTNTKPCIYAHNFWIDKQVPGVRYMNDYQ